MPKCETVCITDGGGRGAAIAHGYSKSAKVGKIVAIPGNDLMSMNLPDGFAFDRVPEKLAKENAHKIAQAICDKHATIADVCQDDAVAGGVVNYLEKWNIPVVGPTKEAGRVEWDKEWSRQFMQKYGIAHPAFHSFHNPEEGVAFLRREPDQKWAVKASGLALGKGVILAANNEEAIAAVYKMKEFGDAGATYLIEQFLEGEEFSAFAPCDGQYFKILGTAQDHKRLYDGDTGPNTGGMGCSSSPLIVTPDILRQTNEILEKTFQGLSKEGCPYRGILYLGAMVVDGKVFVIEYNSRWGDQIGRAHV